MKLVYPQLNYRQYFERSMTQFVLTGGQNINGPFVKNELAGYTVPAGKMVLIDSFQLRCLRAAVAAPSASTQMLLYLYDGTNYATIYELYFNDNTLYAVYSIYQVAQIRVAAGNRIQFQYSDGSTGGTFGVGWSLTGIEFDVS